MNWFEEFLNGAIAGLGMWLMMTVMGILSFYALKKHITRWIAKIWADIKKEAVKLDGLTIEGRLKTKKEKKREQE